MKNRLLCSVDGWTGHVQTCLFLAMIWIGVLRPTSAAAANPTLADFWNGRAQFQVQPGYIGANFGMIYLSTKWVNGTLNAYYISPDSGVGLATSRDGVNFQNRGTVIHAGAPGAWDSRMASFPGVWYDGSTWYCVYEGAGQSSSWPGDIGLATSRDGVNWTKLANPILKHAGGWERNNIGTPSLWKEGPTWYLFYHGFGWRAGSPDDCQVGLATGTDLRNLHRFGSAPIVPTSTSGWDSGTIGRRSIVKEGIWYYMIYEGSTDQPYERAKWSSGVARSRDLVNWTKYGSNILPQTASGFGYDGPELVRLPTGTLAIYFRSPRGPTQRALLIWKR